MAQFAIDEILTTGIAISGFVFDVSNNIGANGYVLTSTSSGVMWQQDSSNADLSALSGQIAATGSLLNNRINSLSGYANNTFLSGSGVANYVARWSNTKQLITGSIYDLGTAVGVGITNPAVRLDVSGGNARFSDYIIVGEDLAYPSNTGSAYLGYSPHTASSPQSNLELIDALSNAIGVNDPLRFRNVISGQYFSGSQWYEDPSPLSYRNLLNGNVNSSLDLVTSSEYSVGISGKRFVVDQGANYTRPNFILLSTDWNQNWWGFKLNVEHGNDLINWTGCISEQTFTTNNTKGTIALSISTALGGGISRYFRFSFVANQAITAGSLRVNKIRSLGNQNYSSTIPVSTSSTGHLIASVGIISPTITSLSGNLAATGSVLDTKINTLSGYSNSTFATITNLATTGSVLNAKINSLSGYITTEAVENNRIYRKCGLANLPASTSGWYKIAQFEQLNSGFIYDLMHGEISYIYGENQRSGNALVNFNAFFRQVNNLASGEPFATYSYELRTSETFKSFEPFRIAKTVDLGIGPKTYELQVSPIGNTFGLISWDIKYTSTSANSRPTVYGTEQVAGNIIDDPRVSRFGNKIFTDEVGIGIFDPLSLLSVGGSGSTTALSGITFGGDSSVNLYRSAAGALKTDASLGIGINPVQKLQVEGVVGNPASIAATQSGIFRISNTTDNAVLDFGIRAGGLGAWIQSTDETALDYNYPLLLNPNGARVGVGLTTSISGILHVRTPAAGDQTLLVLEHSAGYSNNTENRIDFFDDEGHKIAARIAQYYSTDSNNRWGLKFYTNPSAAINPTPALTLRGNNNVGVGTTSPIERLHVSGNIHVQAESNSVGGNGIYLGDVTNRYLAIRQTSTNKDFAFDTYNNTESWVNRLTILNNGGNVGINSTAPNTKLRVNGSFSQRASGTPAIQEYKNIVTFSLDGNGDGGYVVKTPFRLGSTYEMVILHVKGYGYGIATFYDFKVVFYDYAPSHAPVNYSIVDLGNDGSPKYLAKDADNYVQVCFGNPADTNNYYYRFTVDCITTRQGNDYSQGWGMYQTTGTNFGFASTGVYQLNSPVNFRTTNYVGIGTTNPQNRLSVIGAVNIGSNNFNTTAPTNGLIVEGNVGIGTTVPNSILELYKVPATSGTLQPMLTITSDYPSAITTNFGSSIVFKGRTAGNVLQDNAQIAAYNEDLQDNGYALGFYTRPSVGSGIQQRMTILRGGNVGIGTTSPDVKLHVRGDQVYLYNDLNTNNTYFYARNSSAGNAGIKMKNSQGEWTIIANDRLRFIDDDAGVERLSILSNGNVGIGIVAPTDKIQISGGGISFTTSTGLAVPMLGLTAINVAYIGPYATSTDGNAPTLVVFNQGASVQQTYFYSSGKIAMVLNKEGRLNIAGNAGNTPPALLNVGPTSSVDAVSGMSFGNDSSANLYRSAASIIKTDGSLDVTSNLLVGSDLYVADELGVGVPIANKRFNYGAQIEVASASIQLVLSRGATATGQGAIGADASNVFAVWNVSGGLSKPFVITQQGSVGIGSETPTQKLDVSGTLKIKSAGTYSDPADNAAFLNYDTVGGILTLSARSNAGNTYMAFRTSNGGTGSEKVRITNNGLVGISSNAPTDFLDFGGAGKNIVFGYAAYGEILNSAASIVGNNVKASPTANSQVRRFANANDQGNFIKLIYNKGVTFHTNITSALNTDISEDTNERMRIDLSGNVGIGTITPSGRLHIVESSATGTRIQLGTNTENASMNAGSTNDLLILNAPYGTNSATISNSGAKWGIKFIGTLEGGQFNSTTKTSAIYAVSEDPTAGYNRGTSLAFYTNAWFDQGYTERMRIFHNGNIGIGTTQPSYKLQIVGSGTPTSPTVLQVAGLNDAGGDAKLIISQSPVASDLQLLVAGTDTRSDGLNANDQYILAGQQLNLFNRGNGSTYNTQIMIGRDGGYGNISFSTAPQNQTAVVRMYIASGGNVGIGTITPSKLLHVHGDSGEILRLSMPSNYTAGAGPQLSFWHRGDEELASIRGVFNESSQGNRANLLFGTRTSDALGVETKMTILHNGNVGIGNTIPTGLLNVIRNSSTAQPIAFFKELFGTPPATNILLLERGNNLTAANQLSSNAGLRIRDHLVNYSLSVEDHNSNVNFAISGTRVMLGSRGTDSLLNIGGAGSTLAASGITFGQDPQVNLYRIAENTLRTDAAFTNGNITLLGGDLLFASDGGGDGFQFDYYQGKMYIGNYGGTAWHMVIQDNGYVGIGTTQPTGKLHVVSTVAGETVLRADGTNGTLFSVVDDLSDSLMSVNNSAGLPVLEVFADDRVVAGQYGSGDFVVTSNKVGIGRTNPGEKLDVNGSIRLGVTVSNTIGTSNVSSLQTQAINIQPNSSTDTLYIRNLSAGNYQLQTVTASANGGNLHLQPYGGNVGIGTTNPSSKLHIYDNGGSFRTDLDATYHMGIFNEYVSTYVTRTKFGRYSNTSNLEIYYDIAGTEEARITRNLSTAVLKFNRSSTTDMIIDGVGNVGIGTNAPTNTLQVVGQIAIKGNESADNAKIYIQASDNSNRYTVETDLDGNTNNDLLIFRSNTADNMLVLKGNGNIGINTTNPADKIHISGGGISFTSSTGLAIPMLGVTATNVAYVGPYTTTAEGVSPSLVLFNQGASVQQTWFYSSGRVAMVLNKEGRLHIGNANNTPNCLLSVGPSSSTTAVSGMCFGNDAEANLYRSAEDTIKTDGNLIVVGNVTAANLVSGNGTANYITKWNGTKSIANSQIFDDGTYVGVNTAVNTTYRLQVNGSFAATTKSFDITHPTISGKRLVYASLEGPENGVYFRGRNNNNEINLPHYWSGLVHDDSITIDLTSIGKRKDGRIRNYSVDQIGHNKVYIYTDSDDNIYDYYYTIFAERKDVSKLVIERDME